MNKKKKKPYTKPGIIYREKVDVLAAVCDSSWNPAKTCMVTGQPSCEKVR